MVVHKQKYFLVRLGPRYRRTLKAYARLRHREDGNIYHESDGVRAGIDLLAAKMKADKKKRV